MVRLLFLALVALTFIYAIQSAPPNSAAAVAGKTCGPVKCPGKPKQCAYGYQKTKDGCDICKCNDPCNPVGKAKLCGAGQRCHVEKKTDGTFGTRCDAAKAKKGKGNKDGKTGTKA